MSTRSGPCLALLRWGCLIVVGWLPGWMTAAPVDFDIPPQAAASALLAFSAQSGTDVLYSANDVRDVSTPGLRGRYEPVQALSLLLRPTPLVTRQHSDGKFVVMPATHIPGAIRGRLFIPGGTSAAGARILLKDTGLETVTDARGRFHFPVVPAGTHQLEIEASNYRPIEITGITVPPGRTLTLRAQTLAPAGELTQLEPYVIEAEAYDARQGLRFTPRQATGNLDLLRTENDALPFTIHTREQIVRSGVVDLNEFLQRVVLESDAATQPPEQNVNLDSFTVGSTNLKLRGYDSDETVVLVNGRRLPEVLTSFSGSAPPDVNFIPINLVQQIEVLPVSASALYSGNPVGGVINIVLRPDADATEVTTTYTNALGGFDAPQSSFSLQHGQSLLGGALRLRLSAGHTRIHPATESELGYRQAAARERPLSADQLYRATPNIRSVDGSPLFGHGSSSHTSVAPGADGTGGLAAFAGREGQLALDFFDSPGGLAASLNSLDSPYARKQSRTTWFGSLTYDAFPWLQLGLDGAYVSTVVNRGYDVFTGDLTLPASSPLNPFGQTVAITLNETAPHLGENYSEARIDYTSVLAGALLRLPDAWQITLDAQLARNLSRYRGLAGADGDRWQQLVDQGRYNPLRDTQRHPPPAALYDEVLIFHGGPDRFVTVGHYETLDASARLTQPALRLPTGEGILNLGADYRLNRLASYTDEKRYADDNLAQPLETWAGRSLERYSFFGELQAPLLPRRWLSSSLHSLEGSLAARYVASSQSNETNFAPTFGLKAELAGGFILRGSFTHSNRMPTPRMSRRLEAPTTPGSGLNLTPIFDPLRQESYDVQADEAVDFTLNTEEAVTQTAGVVWQRGQVHRFRAALDFVDTTKVNEILGLDAQATVNLEALFPERVLRNPASPGGPGRITQVITGGVNAASRRSQHWTGTLDYTWNQCLGGTLELRGRLLWFQRYENQLFEHLPWVDQFTDPDGSVRLLRYRANLNAAWSSRHFGLGFETQYFHAQRLPTAEWPAQRSRQIDPYWQCDAYVQADIGRWLPRWDDRRALRAQLRVNNLLDAGFPRYASASSGAGVQPYGDWRQRTYSVSFTATF